MCEEHERYDVRDSYFKARSGLISGLNIRNHIGKPVRFINCEFHPHAVEVIKEFGKESGWEFVDCEGSGLDEAI